jgi:hypothetical protein
MFLRSAIAITLSVSLVTGCAASQDAFYSDRSGISDVTLCRTQEAAQNGQDAKFKGDLRREIVRRGLSSTKCQAVIKDADNGIALGIFAVIVLGALAGAAANGGGGGYVPTTTQDVDWDWDQFYNEGQLVWMCRGIQTGQFAESSNCAADYKSDARWPDK